MQISKTNITIIAVIIFLTLAVGYMYFSAETEKEETGMLTGVVPTATPTPVPIPVIEGPDNWRTYWNNEWQIGFKYPQNWPLEERRTKEDWLEWDKKCEGDCGRLRTICLAGDGYHICIDKLAGGGMSSDWIYPYKIDEYTPRTWQIEHNEGYHTTLARFGSTGLIIRIITPNKTKEITDKILSTIKIGK